MKKRLLISSVLMSAVLACALGTGTYAWYSAVGSLDGTAADVTMNGDVSVTGPTGSASSLGYTVTATVTEHANTEGKTLILSDYEESAWVSKYNVAGGETRTHVATATEVYYKIYEVKVSGEMTGNDTNNEFDDLLAASEEVYTITFASEKGENTQAASFWTVGGTTAPTANNVAYDSSKTTLSIDLKDVGSTPTTIGYLCVFIDGSVADHTGTVTAEVTATADCL